MNIKYFLNAVLLAAVTFSGCSDDVLEEQNNMTPWHEGDDIMFGARGGFENSDPKSRTIYTGEFYTEESTGKVYEKINWVPESDSISILSPQAYVSGGGEFADYKVIAHEPGTGNPGANYDFASIRPADQNKALQWGSAETHQFYACYPTYESTTIPGIDKYGIKLEKKEGKVFVSGTVPNNQIPYALEYVDIANSEHPEHAYKGYVARPFMRNAHMVAYGTHNKSNPEAVNLTFKSIVTVLEIDLVGSSDAGTNIIGALVGTTDPSQKLVGNYQCEINEHLNSEYPICTNITQNQTTNQILIPLLFKNQPSYGNNNVVNTYDTPKGVVLRTGEHLKFNAFILPTDLDEQSQKVNLKNLNITLITLTGRRTHLIPVGAEGFKAHLKHYVNNVKLPQQFNSANWMRNLDDNVYLHQLSIPGSGSSFSNTYASSNSDWNYYQTQTLSIEEQWNKGIRCFEIISDRGQFTFSSSTSYTLTGEPVIGAKGAELTTTVDGAVDQIFQLVKKHPTEFAIIMMTYQPELERKCDKYIESFDNFYKTTFLGKNDVKDVAKYNPIETLGNVRGKVMFVLRATSDGEDMLGSAELGKYSDRNYTIIDGWGSLQDKWKQRGYPTKDTNPGDKYNGNYATGDWNGSMEILMTMSSITNLKPDYSKFPIATVTKGDADYTYKTNTNLEVWAQEWNRVVPDEYKNFVGLSFFTSHWVAWPTSYTEKLNDAKATFDKVCKENTESRVSKLYFNCLTGYFINKDDDGTFVPVNVSGNPIQEWGSSHGDVVAFSDKINTDFFTHLWGAWYARKTGPLGVIMMNRISSGDEKNNEGNFYMPNVVISNNFSFPLEKAPRSSN